MLIRAAETYLISLGSGSFLATSAVPGQVGIWSRSSSVDEAHYIMFISGPLLIISCARYVSRSHVGGEESTDENGWGRSRVGTH